MRVMETPIARELLALRRGSGALVAVTLRGDW
jgi:hypothetical protein